MTPALLPLVAFVLGVVLGAALSWGLTERSFRLAAKYHTTGTVPMPSATPASGPVVRSPEARAHLRAMEDAVKVGAERLMAAAEEAGVHLPRKDAEAQARQMVQATDPLGGAR